MIDTKRYQTKHLQHALQDILSSRAESRIYLYLLRKKAARTEEIIKATKLHPSTVRETLSTMYTQQLIIREKINTETIGKKPYLYKPASPLKLIHKKANELENKLNAIAQFAGIKNKTTKYIQISINEEEKNLKP